MRLRVDSTIWQPRYMLHHHRRADDDAAEPQTQEWLHPTPPWQPQQQQQQQLVEAAQWLAQAEGPLAALGLPATPFRTYYHGFQRVRHPSETWFPSSTSHGPVS
jgi:hypothetical protein